MREPKPGETWLVRAWSAQTTFVVEFIRGSNGNYWVLYRGEECRIEPFQLIAPFPAP